MTYAELSEAGRKMTPEQVNDSIRSLATDPRFAAVAAWLDRNHDDFVVAGAAQKIADSHGKLAHCGGSTHAIRVLRGQLAEVLNPSPKRTPQRPEDAE